MCELVAQEDLSLDVATGGELAAARAAGFPLERVYFHGNNKSPAEIELGLDLGIGHFVVDSFEEIERLEAGRGRARHEAAGARARHAGRAAQHARLHPDRPAGQQVRLRAGRRPRPRGRAAPARRAAPRARGRARPHRLADLRAGLVPARGRGALRGHRRLAPRLRLRVLRVQHRRRPRHPLHGQRPAQLHRRVRGDRRGGGARRRRRATASTRPSCSSSPGAASPARPA